MANFYLQYHYLAHNEDIKRPITSALNIIKKIDNIYSNTDGLIIAPSDGNSTNNEHTINIIIA